MTQKERIEKIFWNYLHTVTLAHNNEPNEPHRQVIFKQEIPILIQQIKEWACGRLEKKKDINENLKVDPWMNYDFGFNDCHNLSTKNIMEE